MRRWWLLVLFGACSKGVTPPNIGLAGSGAPCQSTDACGPSLYCTPQKTCAASGTGAAGASCASSGDCQKNFVCAYSGIIPLCTAAGTAAVGAAVGAACTRASDCAAGLGCQAGTCASGVDPLAAAPFALQCPNESSPPFKAYFKVPELGTPLADFFELPFPNEARVQGNGQIDLEGFPAPASGPGADLIKAYVAAATTDTGGGFSLNPVVTFRFTAPVDPNSIQFTGAGKSLYFVRLQDNGTAAPTLGCDASAGPWEADAFPGVVDILPGSPEDVCPNSVSVRPSTAFPLLPNTSYAVILTTDVKSTAGDALQADDDLLTLLGTTRPSARPQLERAFDCYAPLRNAGNTLPATSQIAAATVFRTQAMAEAPLAVVASVKAQTPAITALVKCGGGAVSPCHDPNDPSRDCPATADAAYDEYHGTFSVPVLQQGLRPYLTQGGNITYTLGGAAPAENDTVAVQGTEQVCFSVAMPKTAPVGVVIYGHGTGGNFRSPESEAAGSTGTLADALVGHGLAVWTWDQPMHGPRRNSPLSPDVLYFNTGNPAAARDNALQAVADALTSVRTLQNITSPIYGTIDASEFTSHFGATNALVYLGHSQGASNALPFGAVDTGTLAMALSGVGGGITQTLLGKTQPFAFATLLANVLDEKAVSEFDPVLGLMQMVVDRSDGINYGRYYRELPSLALPIAPATSVPHKSLFALVGVGDSYAPLATTSDLWRTLDSNDSAAAQPRYESDASVEPGPTYSGFPDDLGQPRTAALPVFPAAGLSCNCTDATGCANATPATAGAYTMALALYAPPAGQDGHFVLFDDAAALTQTATFLADTAKDGGTCGGNLPTIP